MLQLTHCVVDLDRRRVSGPAPATLTCREAALLRHLAAHPDRAVPRDEVLREAFGYSHGVVTRAVDCVVRRLRVKIEADPDDPVHLLTEFGVGYRLSLVAAAEPVRIHAPRELLTLSGCLIDLSAGVVHRDGERVALVGNEVPLLRELARANGRAVDPGRLERAVWGTLVPRSNRMRSLVWRVRSKIEADPDAPVHLLLRRGHGYCLSLPQPSEDLHATVVAVWVDDLHGHGTEQLWSVGAEIARESAGFATNLAVQTLCLVFPDPADAVRAARRLTEEIPGARIAIAAGVVRRITPRGAPGPEYVGTPVLAATLRCRRSQAHPDGAFDR